MLEVKDLSFSYNKVEILKNVSFDVKEGEFVGLIGANGSGKTTLLKNIYKSLTPKSGTIKLNGKDLIKMSFKDFARNIAVVGQENELHFDFKVEEIVLMGRNPHKKLFEKDNLEDEKIINNALEKLGIMDMKGRSYLSLSGGEKQRVIIARSLAQEPKFLILDEPLNHLDINFRLQTLEQIKGLNITVLSAIHDLSLASVFCDRLIVLKNGQVVLNGTPKEILTNQNILDIYNVDIEKYGYNFVGI